MKKLTLIALAAALAGCCTCPCKNGGETRPTAPKQAVQSVTNMTARQVSRYLRVCVTVAAGDDSPADKKLAELLAPNLQKALRAAGFDVVLAGDAEMALSATARCQGATKRGSRVVCRGGAELTFMRKSLRNPFTRKEKVSVVNSQRFDAKSGEARSDEEALASLADNISAPLAKWLGESSSSLAADLALCTVSVTPANSRHAIPADYPTRFVREVCGIPGVYDCRLDPQEASGTMFNVNILYDTRQVPDGILNRLASVHSLSLVR